MSRSAEFSVNVGDAVLVGWVLEAAGKPTALMLHGGPRLNDYLASLADELDGALTTAHYQQRGQAPSTPAGPYDIETHARDAVAVMDGLGWERPVLIGHSWGGHLALHVATAQPDRIGALVVIDALGAVGDGGAAELGRRTRVGLSDPALARLAELGEQDQKTDAELNEELGILWPNYFGNPDSAPPMPEFRFAQDAAGAWNSIQEHLEKGTLERGLPNVQVPALVIHGDRSPIPLEQAQELTRLMPNARLVVHKGMGHFPWLEDPGFVRRQVEEFVLKIA